MLTKYFARIKKSAVVENKGDAGSPIVYQDSPEFEKYVQADAKRMVDVVKRMGKLE